MAKSLAGAFALALLPAALAFQNTSPFFFFSTADLTLQQSSVEVAPAEYIDEYVREKLGGCPSRTYFVVRQDGVSSTDFVDGVAVSRLASYMTGEHANIKTTISVTEATGNVDADALAKYIQTACGAELQRFDIANGEGLSRPETQHVDAPPQVISITLPRPAGSNRAHTLAEHDRLLEHAIYEFAPSADYTVVYTTTPQIDEPAYEMEDSHNGEVRMELKRDTAFTRRADEDLHEGGLFERYQYFSPGLFMAFTAMIPLVLILVIGIKAIANLEVSYFAFSKEMGPNAQRKLQ